MTANPEQSGFYSRQKRRKRTLIQRIQRNGLCECYKCGAEANMYRNSAGKFQIRCSKCEKTQTRWGTKDDVIIEWFSAKLYGVSALKNIRVMLDQQKTTRTRWYKEAEEEQS